MRRHRLAALSGALLLTLAAIAPVLAAEPSLRPVQIRAGEGQLGALIAPVPALITESGDRGGHVRLDNTSGLAERFTIRVDNYTLNAEGRPVPAPPDFEFGSAAWYRFETTQFVLPPGTSRDIAFSLEVPDDAIPGDHIAALTVTVEADDPPELAATGVRSRLVLQIRLQHRIAGAEPAVPRLEFQARPGLDDVRFLSRITNDGNTVLAYQTEPLAAIELYSTLPWAAQDGPPEQAISLGGFYVTPYSERLVAHDWADPPLLGTYRARLTLPAGDNLPAMTAETEFTVVNWRTLGMLLAAAAISLALIYLVRRVRRRSARARGWAQKGT